MNTDYIEVFTQNSIRIACGNAAIYVDPFQIREELHDADVVLITHDHYDHFSPEDIAKIDREDTVFVVPEKMKAQMAAVAGGRTMVTVKPYEKHCAAGISIETVPAYNNLKPFHPKRNGWVGYIIECDGQRIYIAGDTDVNPDNKKVSCDTALVPIGGTYTMNPKEAAGFVNAIRPKTVIPTHYGTIVGKESYAQIFAGLVDAEIEVLVKKQY